MNNAFRTRAIVLRRTNYGEADRILQFITPEGRRSAMARGVRREKSKLAGGIELFAVSDIVLTKGKGELEILTAARLVYFYRHILKDYDRLQFGYTCIRLVARASETVDETDWFDLLQEVLAGLDALTIPLPMIEAWFYLRYASLLGHELNLSLDAEGNALNEKETYRYDIGEKGLVVSTRGDVTGEHIKLLRLLSTRSLTVLVQVGGVGELLSLCAFIARAHASVD